MPTFALRVTVPYVELNLMIQYLDERCTELVVAEHSPATGTGKVVHCHAYLNSTVGYDSIRDKLKSIYKGGNADYSLKSKYGKGSAKKDVDKGAIKYLLKGRLEPCFVKGVSVEEILNLRSQWVEPVTRLVYASPEDGNIPNTVVERPVRVMDPLLRTQKGMLEVLRTRLINLKYECNCSFCKLERSAGQTAFPVQWTIDIVHENKRKLSEQIANVFYEANKVPDDKTVQKFIYAVYYTQFVSEDSWRTPEFIFARLNI